MSKCLNDEGYIYHVRLRIFTVNLTIFVSFSQWAGCSWKGKQQMRGSRLNQPLFFYPNKWLQTNSNALADEYIYHISYIISQQAIWILQKKTKGDSWSQKQTEAEIMSHRRKTNLSQRRRSCSQIFGLHRICWRLHSTYKSKQGTRINQRKNLQRSCDKYVGRVHNKRRKKKKRKGK